MANEIQFSFVTSKTCYLLIRNGVGQIWNVSAFEAYNSSNYSTYGISCTEQGGASSYYVATFPAAIPPGVYEIVGKLQAGGSPAESDSTIATGQFQWNGIANLPLSDLATSGQISQFLPTTIYRGQMVPNFMFKLVSSLDHITPFTSGVVSGQIQRDATGTFGALQSGAFTEVGLGFYRLLALTSGDLLANSVALSFSARGISGGTSDPRDFSLLLQRTSGQ